MPDLLYRFHINFSFSSWREYDALVSYLLGCEVYDNVGINGVAVYSDFIMKMIR